MRIAFFEADKKEEEYFRANLKSHNLSFFKEYLTLPLVKEVVNADIICIFIHSQIDSHILKSLPNLKYIVTRSTGYDHIDLEECKKRKIMVSNLPAYSQHNVAEHTFALLLALSRHIIEAIKMKKARSTHTFNCFTLNGKVLGVIGTGRIGGEVIKIAKGFGMKILAYDIFPNKKLADEIGFKYTSLSEVLSSSDIISIHVNLTKETYHFIDKKSFNKMKKGVIFINTSRGRIVDTKAMIEAIEKGKISAAGLDVIEDEEIWKAGKDSSHIRKILQKKNVILTPHIAYYSKESIEDMLKESLSNIISFIKGKPKNIVIYN